MFRVPQKYTPEEIAGSGMTSLRARKRLVERLRVMGIQNQHVLDAMLNTPRHLFIEEALAHRAYDDTPLPIGYGQTISQCYVVARMTEALFPEGETSGKLGKILEIGTGSGYQAAILAQLARQVYTVERIQPLADQATARLQAMDYRNVRVKCDDGYKGWSQYAPYDGIIVTAAPEEVPQTLLEQLVDGGRLIIPVGELDSQELRLYIREGERFHSQLLEFVRFVPLVK